MSELNMQDELGWGPTGSINNRSLLRLVMSIALLSGFWFGYAFYQFSQSQSHIQHGARDQLIQVFATEGTPLILLFACFLFVLSALAWLGLYTHSDLRSVGRGKKLLLIAIPLFIAFYTSIAILGNVVNSVRESMHESLAISGFKQCVALPAVVLLDEGANGKRLDPASIVVYQPVCDKVDLDLGSIAGLLAVDLDLMEQMSTEEKSLMGFEICAHVSPKWLDLVDQGSIRDHYASFIRISKKCVPDEPDTFYQTARSQDMLTIKPLLVTTSLSGFPGSALPFL